MNEDEETHSLEVQNTQISKRPDLSVIVGLDESDSNADTIKTQENEREVNASPDLFEEATSIIDDIITPDDSNHDHVVPKPMVRNSQIDVHNNQGVTSEVSHQQTNRLNEGVTVELRDSAATENPMVDDQMSISQQPNLSTERISTQNTQEMHQINEERKYDGFSHNISDKIGDLGKQVARINEMSAAVDMQSNYSESQLKVRGEQEQIEAIDNMLKETSIKEETEDVGMIQDLHILEKSIDELRKAIESIEVSPKHLNWLSNNPVNINRRSTRTTAGRWKQVRFDEEN